MTETVTRTETNGTLTLTAATAGIVVEVAPADRFGYRTITCIEDGSIIGEPCANNAEDAVENAERMIAGLVENAR